MALEGLIIDLIAANRVLTGVAWAELVTLGERLGLDRESVHESSDGSSEWRSTPISSGVCLELLKRDFPADTLLLNKRLPVEVLQALSMHPEPRIRCMVADKRAAATLLPVLASDPEVAVRLRVVWNAKIAPDLLRSMLDDPAAEVRETARLRISQLKGETEKP